MNLRDVITLLIVVAVASVMLFELLGFAVSLVYPDSDPGELHGRVALVLVCLTVLGVVWCSTVSEGLVRRPPPLPYVLRALPEPLRVILGRAGDGVDGFG